MRNLQARQLLQELVARGALRQRATVRTRAHEVRGRTSAYENSVASVALKRRGFWKRRDERTSITEPAEAGELRDPRHQPEPAERQT